EIGGGLKRGVEADAGQIARAFVARVAGGYGLRVARPQRAAMAGAQGRGRERRSPCAAAEHRDLLPFAHAFAPRLPEPTIGAAASSSGQRERGAKASASSSASPARRRSIPAHAIIAALSVHRLSG